MGPASSPGDRISREDRSRSDREEGQRRDRDGSDLRVAVEELADGAAELSSEAARHRERSRQRLAAVDERLERASRRLETGPDAEPEPEDPVAAGLKTLHELRDEQEAADPEDRPDHELDAAREQVQRLHDSVRSLGDVVARYGQDLAHPGEGTPLSAAATTEPRSLRDQRRREAEAKRVDGTDRHEQTKRRLMRLGLVLVAATVISPLVSSLSPAQPFAIATDSMRPSIERGALVVATPGEPEVGDVVVYESALGSHQVHRVVDVTTRDGTTYYTTRGDANERADSFSVPDGNVRGVVDHSVPYAGFLWLIPLELQVGIFVTMLVAYIAITFADDRVLLSGAARRVAAVPLAAALLIPASSAMIQVGWPASSHTAGVADPSPIPLANGTAGEATISADDNSATATAPAPPTAAGNVWKETVMWGCWPFDSSDSGCHLTQVDSTSYATVNGSLTHVDAADYDPAPTFLLEAYLEAPAGEETRVRLFDNGTGQPVNGSVASTTNTSLTRVRSGAFNLSGASEVQFQTMTTNGTAGGEVRQVKLLSRQSDANDTVTRVKLSGGSFRSGGGGKQPLDRTARWRFDAGRFDGAVTVRFEVVAKGTGDVVLRDLTNRVDRSTITFNSDAAVTRQRATVSLADGADHEVQAKTGGNDELEVYMARAIVEQRSLNATARYVDMTWAATSTSPTFTQVGYPGVFHGDGETGNGTGRFEATILNPSGGTVTADLFNATGGQAVAGSEVSTGSGDPVRLRSGWIDMDSGNASYRARIRTDSGDVEIRSAWAILDQTTGTGNRTYDHVLETANDGGCTFDFHLESVSVTNATRMANATITLRNASSSTMQFAIQDGDVTKTSGSPVGLAPDGTLDHLMQTDPDETGRTEVEAELIGRCRDTGVRTIQQVTYVFE